MQLQQLLYLKTVAETGSIRKAGSKLFVSQQAISQSLRNLEDEAGVQLLKRSVHGIILTEAGKQAVASAKQVVEIIDDLKKYFTQQQNSLRESNSLTIAAISTFHDYVLPKTKVEYMQHYPEVTINVTSMSSENVIDAVFTHKAEIGFLGMLYLNNQPAFEITAPLHFIPLYRYNYHVIVSSDSPLNRYHTLSLKSILQYPIIFLQKQLDNNLESYLPYHMLSQFGKVNAIIADSEKLFSNMIAANLGVAIATTGIFEEQLAPNTATKPLRDSVYGYFGYLLHEDCPKIEFIQKFLETLQNTIHSQ